MSAVQQQSIPKHRDAEIAALNLAVARCTGVTAHFLRSGTRKASVVSARALAASMMLDRLGMTLQQVAGELNMTRAAVAGLVSSAKSAPSPDMLAVCMETFDALAVERGIHDRAALVPRAAMVPRGERVDAMIDAACSAFGVNAAHLLHDRRTRGLINARQLVCWLLHERADMSYPEIARLLDRTNHSSTIGMAKGAARLMAGDADPAAATMRAVVAYVDSPAFAASLGTIGGGR